LLDLLEQAGPYGAGNAEPRFALPSCRIINASIVGERHVRCVVTNSAGQGRLKAIAFRSVESALGPALLAGGGGPPLHLAGHLRAEWYRGERRIQLIIEDAAPDANNA
jgi:single-stranded-DNA-specific exonuclease